MSKKLSKLSKLSNKKSDIAKKSPKSKRLPLLKVAQKEYIEKDELETWIKNEIDKIGPGSMEGIAGEYPDLYESGCIDTLNKLAKILA